MGYFKDCRTIDDVKRTFKTLVKELHPDNGGDEEAFKRMMGEYEKAFERLKHVRAGADGGTYTRESMETAAQFAEIVESIMRMDGITLDIIGAWLWLSGNTYAHKERIKELGFLWSKGRKQWFYNGDDRKVRRHSRESMEELKARFGCETVRSRGVAAIAGG